MKRTLRKMFSCCVFLWLFLVHFGVFAVNPKIPKIFAETYRMVPILHQLNVMGERNPLTGIQVWNRANFV